MWWIRILTSVNTIKSNLDYAQELIAVDNPLTLDPDQITHIVTSSRISVLTLQRNTAFLLKFTAYFTWLPAVGDLIGDIPDLFTFADIGTRTADNIWELVKPTYIEIQDEDINFESITILLSSLSSESDKLQEDADLLLASYGKIDSETLPWRYQGIFNQLGLALSLYTNGISLLDDIPLLIGVDSPSIYLVLALNEDELRAGGGFISAAGELVLKKGNITSMDFRDSYSADDFTQPYPDSPSALSQFMAIDLWVFRDSNWSPDFPTSARNAISLYRPEKPVSPLGVISLDQFAAAKIVDVVGPLIIPGSEDEVKGETLVEYMRSAWAPENAEINKEWVWNRKAFMGDITKAALSRIESGAVDWTRLIEAGIDLIEQRHIQIYVDNEDAAQFLMSQGWDSSLILPAQDSFTFAESNVGYNKVSTHIERGLSYSVDLTNKPYTAEVVLQLRHRSQKSTDCTPEVRFYPTYEQSMERCYWAYYRFYVPDGSQLLKATEHPIDAEHVLTGEMWPGVIHVTRADEGAATVFEQAVLLPTASSTELRINYTLPDRVIQTTNEHDYIYRLNLQKQAGLRTVPTHIQLRVPHNAIISNILPEAQQVEQGVFIFDIQLQKNVEIELQFTLPEKE
jgi:hypothetical protein